MHSSLFGIISTILFEILKRFSIKKKMVYLLIGNFSLLLSIKGLDVNVKSTFLSLLLLKGSEEWKRVILIDFQWCKALLLLVITIEERKKRETFHNQDSEKNNQFLFWSFLSPPFRQRFSLPSHNNSNNSTTAATTDIEYDFQGE